jgi:hypothetical protein
MWAVVKQHIFGVPEANRGGGAGPGSVLRVQVGCFVVSELWPVFQRGAKQDVRLSLTDTSLMTWPATWMHVAFSWANGV